MQMQGPGSKIRASELLLDNHGEFRIFTIVWDLNKGDLRLQVLLMLLSFNNLMRSVALCTKDTIRHFCTMLGVRKTQLNYAHQSPCCPVGGSRIQHLGWILTLLPSYPVQCQAAQICTTTLGGADLSCLIEDSGVLPKVKEVFPLALGWAAANPQPCAGFSLG